MKKMMRVEDYIANEFLDDDGYYTVLVNLYKDFDLYNRLSVGEQLELNSEIFDYIDTKSEVIPSNYKLKVKFIGRKLKQEDKEIVEYLVKEHYYVVMENARTELRKITLKMYLMLTLGVLFLGFYFIVVSKMLDDSLALELFSIVGTFAIWESFGVFIFDRRDLLIEYHDCVQNYEQIVEFED